MKKGKTLLTALIVAAVGAALYYGTKLIPAARVKFYGKGVELKNGKLSYKVELINPSKKQVSLSQILLDFYANDYYIGKVYFNQPVILPPNQLTNISLPVTASIIGLSRIALDIANKKNISIRISGTITTQGVNVPINETLPLLWC